MLSLSITDIKAFMAKLLKSEVFDGFDLHSLAIHSFALFEVSKTDAPPKWAVVRPYAFDIVKGGGLPKTIKAVFSEPDEDMVKFLNIHFEEAKITITTGISQKNFSMDKTPHHQWNDHILGFLKSNNIEYINELS
ncbi:MAG: DUF5721 family protein [Defluviitaleaceae bacterium]|nr:DUF5721 family protein [Defluviitaleaceae bacterium]